MKKVKGSAHRSRSKRSARHRAKRKAKLQRARRRMSGGARSSYR